MLTSTTVRRLTINYLAKWLVEALPSPTLDAVVDCAEHELRACKPGRKRETLDQLVTALAVERALRRSG